MAPAPLRSLTQRAFLLLPGEKVDAEPGRGRLWSTALAQETAMVLRLIRIGTAAGLLLTPFLRALQVSSAIADSASTSSAAAADQHLQTLIAGPQRSDKNRVRDIYRHPYETLTFLGLRDDQTVVEIEPGSGAWWTEILAPYLHDH